MRFYSAVLSKNIILRIQKLGRLRGAMYTLLRRSPQRKHHFAYTDAEASARGNVYASAQKFAAKTSFCVYRSWGVCERCCIRFRAGVPRENIILRIQKPTHLREALYTLLFKNLQRNRHFTYTLCRLSRGYLYMDYFVPADCHPKRPPVPSKKAY